MTSENQDALAPLRVIPPGKAGEHRGTCASCGLHLWREGGYRVPGLLGLFCSVVCIECGIAEKTGKTKKIPGAPIGSGARLLAYLKTEAPEVYAKLGAAKLESKRCLECDVTLDDKRSDSRFCNDTHKKRFSRKSQRGQNCEISRDTPIGKQGLTEGQKRSWTDTLSGDGQAPKNAPTAVSASAEENA